jgi:hypothetical protein
MSGPRTIEKDNSHPLIKIRLRQWHIEKFNQDISVLDVYGAHGLMFGKVWSKYDYTPTDGDAIEWLEQQNCLGQDIFDIDPYSSPYDALLLIAQKASKDKIGICCTDGCLRRQAQMRGKMPRTLQTLCGWPLKDNHLFAAIYHNYPAFLRGILAKIFEGWSIGNLAVKYGIGCGRQSTVYFAAILQRLNHV